MRGPVSREILAARQRRPDARPRSRMTRTVRRPTRLCSRSSTESRRDTTEESREDSMLQRGRKIEEGKSMRNTKSAWRNKPRSQMLSASIPSQRSILVLSLRKSMRGGIGDTDIEDMHP